MTELNKAVHVAGTLALALATGSALAADGPRYTYGQLSYIDIEFDDLDGFDADGDALALAGSGAITDLFHIFAGYSDGEIDVDDFGISLDYTQFNLGMGVNYAISDTIDLVGRLAYVSAEIEAGGFSVDEDGYALGFGTRAMITPQFELNGGITYTDLGGDYDSETALDLGAVYNFTDMFAVVGGVSIADDSTQFGIGARAYFGNR